MAEEARTFAERMAKALRLPVALVDERLTSWEAQESLTIPETKQSFSGARRRHTAASKAQRGPDGVDSQAAALILEEFLRSEAAAP
jgi:RNase H-fold protein (predicted Holliday junction resolvase)